MEGRNINKEEMGGNEGALRGPNVDGGWGAWRALENQRAAALS